MFSKYLIRLEFRGDVIEFYEFGINEDDAASICKVLYPGWLILEVTEVRD